VAKILINDCNSNKDIPNLSTSNSRVCNPIEDNDLHDNFPIGTTIAHLETLNLKVRKCHELLQWFHMELNNIGDMFYEAAKVGIDWKMFNTIFEDKLGNHFPKQYPLEC